MSGEPNPIEVETIPELARLVEQVRSTGGRLRLCRDGEDVALLVPAAPKRKRWGRAVTSDDPLFDLIGIGDSGIPGGVSGKKHEHLAQALDHR